VPNTTEPIIAEMARLLAEQKLVPFFGAGISRPHLGIAAAELAHELATEVGAPLDTLLSEVSDMYIDQRGEPAFIDFLKRKLVVATLDDSKASTHRLLLSLGQNVLYTTNQDNIFELTARKYGRLYRRIITIDDLSEAKPGERLLIKFHGDTDVPSSLVFGARSYRARLEAEGHPLDIKLRADLLGKRLLFLGHSFSDENVSKLFASVQKTFAGGMPPSYMIAFEYAAAMDELSRTYGISIIDPRRLYPDATSNAEAFERCLKALCDCTLEYQAQRGLETLFSGGKINVRMATDYEVNAVAQAIENGSFETAVNAFRGAFDRTFIPEYMRDKVTAFFGKLADKMNADDDREIAQLKGALFNFGVPPACAAQAVAFVMAALNRRSARPGFDDAGFVLSPAMLDNTQPIAAAMAVGILHEKNEPISENFRTMATTWFRGWDQVDLPIKDTVRAMINYAWQGSKSRFPWEGLPTILPHKGFHEIMRDMQQILPARFRSPEQD
jgi:hypothetical protein